MHKSRSIRFLLLLTLAVSFTLVLVFTLLWSAHSQRTHLEDYTRAYVEGVAKSYFDAVNTMMISGGIGSKNTLRNKIKSHQDINEVRIIRGEPVINRFGPGDESNRVEDANEAAALLGQRLEIFSRDQRGRVYTLLEPVRASTNYQGVNCLSCHGGNEGDVLGVVRVDYSLETNDSTLKHQLWVSGAIQVAIFVAAFFLTALVIRSLVIERLQRLHDSMNTIATQADLTIQLEVSRHDEIGSVSRAFNRMMTRIRDSMQTVIDNAAQVNQAANVIAAKAETTEREVLAQKLNTDQVASATTQMAASAMQVKENAIATTHKSQQTADAANQGEARARDAVNGIQALNAEVQQGAARIAQLNQRTDDVAAVLEVISSIADQTNLLALNAAIEAARAGEQGRGFAVVADEVRALASRTQDSTKQIRSTIDGLKDEAQECVQIMEHASSLAEQQVESILRVASELQSIALAVRDISQLNQQMESAANEQSQVSESINGNVMEISESAEQTSTDAQETARVAENLLQLANTLQATIGQFTLK